MLRCVFLCLQERNHLPLEGCSNAQSLMARRISGFRRKSRNDAAVVEMWPAVCWPTFAVVDSSSSAEAGDEGGGVRGGALLGNMMRREITAGWGPDT